MDDEQMLGEVEAQPGTRALRVLMIKALREGLGTTDRTARTRDLLDEDTGHQVLCDVFAEAQAAGYAFEPVRDVLRMLLLMGIDAYMDGLEGLWDIVAREAALGRQMEAEDRAADLAAFLDAEVGEDPAPR